MQEHRHDRIELSASDREDSAFKLTLDLYSHNFRASGSAWFQARTIEANLMKLTGAPLKDDDTVVMSGGYFDEGGQRLISEHLTVRVRKLSSVGSLLLATNVFSPDLSKEKLGGGKGGRCDYEISYQGLADLVALIRGVVSGARNAFEFHGFVHGR